jgi:hypothetical protein
MIWFRLYSEFRNDTKLATFTKSEKYDLIQLFCIASECEVRGFIDQHAEDLAAALGLDLETYEAFVDRLEKRQIVRRSGDGLTILQWPKRQYDKPSDAPERVAQRVAKYRENHRETPRETPRKHACNASVTPCNAIDTDTDTELDTESTHGVRESRAPAPENAIAQVESSPLFAAVLEVTNRAQDYRMGRVSPNWRMALFRVVGKLIDDGRTVADVTLYRANLPAFLNKAPPDVTPPQPNQILDNFDRVIAHRERKRNDTIPESVTARKLRAQYERREQRRAEFEASRKDGGSRDSGVLHGVHGRTRHGAA